MQHRVRFVLIGGLAGSLHGSPTVTNDLDICHSKEPDNLERLAAALVELEAKIRGAPDDVPFMLDALTLAAGENFTFITKAGALDCLAKPAGSLGFEELERNSVEIDIEGLRLKIAGLNDLIRMKRAAGTRKDLIELEVLGALREEIERGSH